MYENSINTAFSEVSYSNFIGKTPACVNIRTGELFLNGSSFDQLPKEHKVFIVLHELGHYYLQTMNEEEADAFAFDIYAKMGYSLKESIYVLSENLKETDPGARERVLAQAARAKEFDYLQNKNVLVLENGQIAQLKGKRKAKKVERKQAKRARKYGTNPVTGESLSKKQFKVVKKRGLTQDGIVMSKMQSKLEYGNIGTRRGRTEMRGVSRDGRNTTRQLRSENGNTFGESIGNTISSIMGGTPMDQGASAPMPVMGGHKNAMIQDPGATSAASGALAAVGGTSNALVIGVVSVIAIGFMGFLMSRK